MEEVAQLNVAILKAKKKEKEDKEKGTFYDKIERK